MASRIELCISGSGSWQQLAQAASGGENWRVSAAARSSKQWLAQGGGGSIWRRGQRRAQHRGGKWRYREAAATMKMARRSWRLNSDAAAWHQLAIKAVSGGESWHQRASGVAGGGGASSGGMLAAGGANINAVGSETGALRENFRRKNNEEMQRHQRKQCRSAAIGGIGNHAIMRQLAASAAAAAVKIKHPAAANKQRGRIRSEIMAAAAMPAGEMGNRRRQLGANISGA